jgi:hypothetical protein
MKLFKQLNVQTSTNNILLPLSSYRILAFAVMLLLNTLMLGVKASAIAVPTSANPFAEYVTVFPGQPRSALEDLGFSCPASYLAHVPATIGETCVFLPKSTPFRQVRVHVLQDVIRQTEFVLPKNNLRIALPAGVTSISAASNPFADYISVFPGQPRSALEDLGFSCPASYFANVPDAIGETCVFWSATELFSQVRVYVSHDVIQQIDFVVR